MVTSKAQPKTQTSLPSPQQRPQADVVIFDGHCRFCRGGVTQLAWLDRTQRLAFVSLHDSWVAENHPELTHDQLMAEMFVIDADGNAHGGASALRYLSRRLPLLWPLSPLLHLPFSMPCWRWLYHQIALRRYQIAGKAECDDGTCKVHFR